MNIRGRLARVVCAWLGFAGCACAALPTGELMRGVGFDQHLNEAIPLDISFRDDGDNPVLLSDYFGSEPVLMVFSYFGCSTLCPTVVENLAEVLRRSGLVAGKQYRVVIVSIDPSDSPALAAQKKAGYFKSSQQPEAANAWHFLTGSAKNIGALTRAAGFDYVYDPSRHQYAHPAGLLLLTSGGSIARYFFGFEFTPADLRKAVADASAKRIASPAERLLLVCFHVDASAGKYNAIILGALRWMFGAMLLAALAWAAARRFRAKRLIRCSGR